MLVLAIHLVCGIMTATTALPDLCMTTSVANVPRGFSPHHNASQVVNITENTQSNLFVIFALRHTLETSCTSFAFETGCNASADCVWCASTSACHPMSEQCDGPNTVYWSSDTSGSWSDSRRWSNGKVPTSNNDVIIVKRVTVTIPCCSTHVVKSLTVGSRHQSVRDQPTLNIQWQLTVQGSVSVARGATVVVSHHLVWIGTARIEGNLLWNRYNMIGGQLAIIGIFRVAFSGEQTTVSDLIVEGTVSIESSGSWVLASGKKLEMTRSGRMQVLNQGGRLRGRLSSMVNNGSLWIKSGGDYWIEPSFKNLGQVHVTSGSRLHLSSTALLDGDVVVGDNHHLWSSVHISSNSHAGIVGENCHMSGTGVAVFKSGSIVIETNLKDVAEVRFEGLSVSLRSPQLFQRMSLVGGTVTTEVNCTVSGKAVIEYGTLQGSGVWTFTGSVTFQADYYWKSRMLKLHNATLTIASDAVVSRRNGVPSSSSGLTITGSDDAKILIHKEAKLAVKSINFFTIRGAPLFNDGELLVSTQRVNGAPVVNSGTIVTACLGTSALNVGLKNTGNVTVVRGALSVNGGLISFLGSSVTISEGSRLDLLHGNSTFYPHSVFKVDGTLNVNSNTARVLLLNTILVVARRIQLSLGSMNITEPMNTSNIGTIIAGNSYSYNNRMFEFRQSSGETRVESIRVTHRTNMKLSGSFLVRSIEVLDGLLHLSASTVIADRLLWTNGIIEGSFNAQLQIHSVVYRTSRIHLRTIQLILTGSVRTDRSVTLSLRDSSVVVPQGANTSVTTESILLVQQQGTSNVIIRGSLTVKPVYSKLSSSALKGLQLSVPFECPGSLTVDDAVLWLAHKSNVSGDVYVSGLGSVRLSDSSHSWTGKLQTEGSILLYGGSPQLTVQSPSATVHQLSISKGTVTLDVEPVMLEVRRVTISTPNQYSPPDYSRLYCNKNCSKNCSIGEEILWNGGLIGSTSDDVFMTAEKILVTTSSARRLYTGNGVLVVRASMKVQYGRNIDTLVLGGPFHINQQASLDVQGSLTVSSPSGASLISEGVTIVRYGVTLTVSVPFWNTGNTTVFGNLLTTADGTQNRLRLADDSAVFGVKGSGKQEITSTSLVSGSGRIRADGGTLIISCSILQPMFSGRLEVYAGTLTLNGSESSLKMASVYVAGGSFQLVQASKARIKAVSVSEQGTLTVLDSRDTYVESLTLGCSREYCTVNGNSNLTVGDFSWKQYGRVTGSVTLIINRLEMTSYNQRLDSGRIVVEKSATIAGAGTGTSGNLNFYLNSPGRFIIGHAAIVTVMGKRTFLPRSRSRGIIENAGTVRVMATATDTVEFQTVILNTGRLVFFHGLTTLNSLTVSGNITGGERSALRLTGTVTFTADSAINLSETDVLIQGTVTLNSQGLDSRMKSVTIYRYQTLRMNAPLGLTVLQHLTVNTATLQVSSSISANRLLFNGRTMRGMLSPSAIRVNEMQWTSGTITGNVNSDFLTVVDLLSIKSTSDKRIDRCGVAALSTCILTQRTNLDMRNGGHLYSHGRLTVDASSTWIGYRHSTSYITNNGTMVVSGGTGSVNVYATLINGGEINVRDGTLSLFRDSVSDPGAQLNVANGSTVHFASGSHSFVAASRVMLNFTSRLLASNRATVTLDSNETLLMIPYLYSSSNAHVIFNTTAMIDTVVLNAGSLTLKGRSQVRELEMKGNQASLKGGRPGFIALISIHSLTFGGGSIVTASSWGKYLFVNVTNKLLFNGDQWQAIDRADILVYGTAIIETNSGVSLLRGSRLVNTRRGSLRYIHGSVSYRHSTAGHYWRDRQTTGFVVNLGSLTVETTGKEAGVRILTPLINTNGRVDVILGVLQLDGGGQSNGTRDVFNIQNQTKLIVSSYPYEMSTEALSGEGLIEIASSNVVFSSGKVSVPVILLGGSVTVPSGVQVNFTRPVRSFGSRALSVEGVAIIANSLEIYGQTSQVGDNGNKGTVRIERRAVLDMFPASSSTQAASVNVFIDNYGTVELNRLVSLNSLWRNEKQGIVDLFGEGRLISSRSGHLENVGLYRCTDLNNVHCATSATLTNYGEISVTHGTLAISNGRLYDGSTVGGPGTVQTSSGMQVGGIIDGKMVVLSGLTIEGPLIIKGELVWTNGPLTAKTTVCSSTSDYFSRNNILKTSCQDSFIVNEGTVNLSTDAVKTLQAGLHFANHGRMYWTGGELRLQSPFVNEQRAKLSVRRQGGTPLKVTGSFTNHGNFVVVESSLSVSGSITNDGHVDLETVSFFLTNYLQSSETSRLSLVESTLQGTSIRLNGGHMSGYGKLKGTVHNAGAVMAPHPRGLIVDGVYEQSALGSLHIRIDGGTSGIVVSKLSVQGDVRLNGLLTISWSVSAYETVSSGQSFTVVSLTGTVTGTFNHVQSKTDSGKPVDVTVVQEPGQVNVIVV